MAHPLATVLLGDEPSVVMSPPFATWWLPPSQAVFSLPRRSSVMSPSFATGWLPPSQADRLASVGLN